MKIYTKGGDKGKTRLYGGDSVYKNHSRVEAYGTIDELTSLVGVIVALMKENEKNEKLDEIIKECETIQQQLFDCGSDLATPRNLREYKQKIEDVNWLEEKIDTYMPLLPKLESFIIPGGCKIGAMLHLARTVTRRAERNIVSAILENESINEIGQMYINRLSDYFFVIARLVNLIFEEKETTYIKGSKVFKS